jgi:hypothetical protein
LHESWGWTTRSHLASGPIRRHECGWLPRGVRCCAGG